MMKLLDIKRARRGRKRAIAKAIAFAAYAIIWKTADVSAGNVVLPGELPAGEQLVAGQATVTRSGSSMDIVQTTDRAILNWQTFNIGAQAKVEFHQPDAHAAVLNRVLTSDPSGIYGALRSNGQVFLVNPSGIVFGKGASVNVGSLVASTMSIGDRDFLNGTYHFNRNGSIAGIVNHGNIVAADGGCVALFAPEVTSDGLISARLGSVMLASGEAITLRMGRDDLYSIAVDPSKVASAIENRGMIQADGGHVLMQASTAGELLGSVINNGGTVQARTAENRNGTIVLLGDMESGSVQVSGTLDASAPDGGDGGFIETSAAHVRIDDGTKVTTLATNGKSGTWLIDPHDFTIGSDRTGTITGGTPSGDISGTTLQNALAAGNVTILSSQGSTASGSGDINVNDNVTWWNNTLTLTAAKNININAVLSVRDSNPGDAIDASDARLIMNTATANGSDAAVSGGKVLVGLTSSGFTGRVDFDRSGTGVLTINGQGYTIIKDISALQGIQSDLDGRYALGGTIDASSTATSGFTPLGNSTTKFTGVLDGLGHTINNLTINRPAADYVGLFGYVSNADIRNVGFFNESVSGLGNVGGLAGRMDNSTVISVSGAGNVRGKTNVGGLVGTLVGSTITTSSNQGTVTGSGTDATSRAKYIGGLVGFVDLADASSSIARSSSSGSVTSTVFTSAYNLAAENIGGLVGGTGINTGAITQSGLLTISGSWSSADVTGESYVGGLIGRSSAYITTDTSTGTILKSYSTGKITGIANGSYSGPTGSYIPGYIGGLVGYNEAVAGVNNSGNIVSAYHSTGAVYGQYYYVGGLVGYSDNGSITDSSNTCSVQGNAGSRYIGGIVGKTDGTTILNSTSSGDVGMSNTAMYVGGLVGDAANTTILNSTSTCKVSGVFYIGGLVGNGNNITISGSHHTTGDIGGSSSTFVGGLVGFGSSVNISNSSTTNGNVIGGSIIGGLAGFVSSGQISSSSSSVSISAGSASVAVGGLVGQLTSASITNSSYFSGSFTMPMYQNIGGLAGFAQNSTISDSWSVASVSGTSISSNIGGLVGSSSSTTISNSHSTGAVSGNGRVGGLVGIVSNGGIITNSWSSGNVTTTGSDISYIGGLAGFVELGTESSSITRSYASGSVSGGATSQFVGGLVGGTDTVGISAAGLLTIAGSWSTGIVSGGSYVGGLVGRSSAYITTDTSTGSALYSYSIGTVSASGDYVGGLVGYDESVSGIDNSGLISGAYHITGSVAGGNEVGGLVGYMTGSGLVNGSYASVQVNGANNVGGLVGRSTNVSSIDLAYATGTVSGSSNVGGLVGLNDGASTIDRSYYQAATVTGQATAGGLVGRNTGSGSVITRSFSFGSVSADNTVGGLVGLNESGADINNSYSWSTVRAANASDAKAGGLVGSNASGATISNSYSTGRVTATGAYAGGLIGMADDPSHVIRCFWDNQTSGWTTSAAGTGLSTAQMKSFGTFSDSSVAWDISKSYGEDKIWRIYDTDSYPLLHWYLIPLSGPYAVDSVTKTYDGSSFTGGTVSPALPSYAASDVFFGGSAQGAKNASTYHITLWSNIYDVNVANGTLTIDPKDVTISAIRDYDGTADFAGSVFGTVNGVTVGGVTETLTVSGKGTVSDRNVYSSSGSYNGAQTLLTSGGTVSGLSLVSGTGLASNYKLVGGTGEIRSKGVTLTGVSAADKEYDGTRTATLTGWTIAGLVGSETLGVSGYTALFDTKDAATDKTVTVSGMTFTDGANGGVASNYTVSGSGGTTTADITPKEVIIAANREYDGTADFDGGLFGTVNGVTVGGVTEMLTVSGKGTVSDRNVYSSSGSYNGAQTLLTSGGTVSGLSLVGGTGLASNYRLVGGTGEIRAKGVTLTGVSAADKEYDGTRTATLTGWTIAGLVGSETLGVSGYTALFDTKDAATDKTVTVSGMTFTDGANGGVTSNYAISGSGGTTTADITPKEVIIAANREYDGTADFDGGLFGAVNGVTVGGETETLTVSGTGTVIDKNVYSSSGSYNGAQTLLTSGGTVSGLSLVGGTGLASNYKLVGGTGEIRSKGVTLTGVSAADKEYDGTRTATLTGWTIAGLVGSETLGVSGYTALFDTKDAGPGKTVTVSGMTFTDGANGGVTSNYAISGSGGTTTADITPKEVIIAANREYDGTADFDGGLFGAVNGVTVGGVTEMLTLSGKGTVSDRNVYSSSGSYNGAQTLLTSGGTVSGLSLVGGTGLASNYRLVGGTGEIRAKGVTLTGVSAADKEYDGTRTATLTGYTLTGLVGSETLGVSGYTALFDTKDAGPGKTVMVSGMTFTDGANGGVTSNYAISGSGGTTTADITPKEVIIAANREYDGTADFDGGLFGTVNGVTVGGVTEMLTVSGKGTVSDRNVYSSSGSYNGAQTLLTSGGTVSGLSLVSGTGQSSNYRLVSGTGEIRAKGVTLTGVSAADKEYDGTRTATLTSYTLTGLVGSETLGVSGYTALFNTKDAGPGKTVMVSGMTFTDGANGGVASNYTVSGSGGTTRADITPKEVIIAANREYDGTADFDGGMFGTVNGVTVGGMTETLTVSGKGTVSDRNVYSSSGSYNGAQTLLTSSSGTVVGLSLVGGIGVSASNYRLVGGTGEIRAKGVTLTGVSAADKEYDGTRTATLTGYTLTGLVGSETLGVSGYTALYDTKDAGTDKTVTVSGMTFIDGANGGLASNYTVTSASGSTLADITPKVVTLTGVSAADKEYDGNRDATLTGYILDGLVGSETLGVSGYTAEFDTKNAGTGKTVTVSGMTFTDGTGGGSVKNYTIDAPEVTTYAHIYPKALTITANDSQKFYDGVPYAGGNGVTYSGFVPGEDASVLDGSLVYRGSSQGAVAAGVYTITPYGMSSGNYDVTYVSGVLNIITNEESYVYVTFDDDRNIWHSVEMIPSMFVKYEPMIVPGFVCVRDQDPIARQ